MAKFRKFTVKDVQGEIEYRIEQETHDFYKLYRVNPLAPEGHPQKLSWVNSFSKFTVTCEGKETVEFIKEIENANDFNFTWALHDKVAERVTLKLIGTVNSELV